MIVGDGGWNSMHSFDPSKTAEVYDELNAEWFEWKRTTMRSSIGSAPTSTTRSGMSSNGTGCCWRRGGPLQRMDHSGLLVRYGNSGDPRSPPPDLAIAARAVLNAVFWDGLALAQLRGAVPTPALRLIAARRRAAKKRHSRVLRQAFKHGAHWHRQGRTDFVLKIKQDLPSS